MTTDEVFDRVDRFLTQSMKQGLNEVHIVTGKGTGKVKAKVQEYLKLGNFPFAKLKNQAGAINDGVLVVYL